MNKHNLPQAPQASQPAGLSFDLSPQALERWQPELSSEDQEQDNTITIFDRIGIDPWTGEGVSAKRIAAALRSIGPENDVTVLVNSQGGSMFEGFAIYNLLREHKGKVTVKVLGLAASAAADIIMAGDEIQIARAAFIMIHNGWIVAIGDKNDLRQAADWLEPFDQVGVDICAARTGVSSGKIAQMMDDETWIGGEDAVKQGFADTLLDSDQVQHVAFHLQDQSAARKIEAHMIRAGVPRSERRKLIQEIKSSKQDAAGTGTPSATSIDKPCAVKTFNLAAGAVSDLSKTLLEEIKCQK